MTAKQTGLRGKVRDGTVVSDKMQKTVVVAIEANFRHRLYKKTVRRVRRLLAHDEREEAKLGDRVRIMESRPISARKRWRLLEVLVRAELPEVAPESIDLELLGEVKPVEPETEEQLATAPETAEVEEPAPAEAVAGPEAEVEVPEEIEVEAAEAVPEVEAAVEEEPAPDEAVVAEAEPESEAPAAEEKPPADEVAEAEAEPEAEAPVAEEEPAAEAEAEEEPPASEAQEEEKPS